MSNTTPAARGGGLGTAVSLALAAALLFWGPLRPAAAVAAGATNAVLRGAERQKVLLQVRSWPHLAGGGFNIYYAPGLGADAAVVAAAARTYYPEVLRDYGLAPGAAPAVLVVLSSADMARYVGAGSGDPPLGAYYEGVVWLLAPSAFLPPGPDLAGRYAQDGPVAHELTHLADDLRSGGRIPAWFDEGLAQYEDWRLTGYVWTQADNGFGGSVYSWTQLTQGFAQLPDAALAYRQALAATASVCRAGPGTCTAVLRDLRAGMSMDKALLRTVGASGLAALEAGTAWRPGTAPRPGGTAGPRP